MSSVPSQKMMAVRDSDDEVVALYLYWRKRRRRKRFWAREIFLHREQVGEFHQLIPQLERDVQKFYEYFRMNKQCYELLISKVKPLFNIGYTNCRQTISFEERLVVTLRYLATGDSYHSASFRFRISHNHISKIVNEMLILLYEGLREEYLQFPDSDKFEKIATEYYRGKKFPNCIGAIDGKHVRIRKPFHGGTLYYNYKHYNSIILLAIVDMNYKFVMIDVGSYGKNSDGGVFEHSTFGRLFNSNQLDLPKDKPFPGCTEAMPFVFIGDEAFKLSKHLMKPYPQRNLNDEKRIYNYRLSFARQMVECTFGIYASKFRIFENAIAVFPDKVDKIIKAACALHNFIRTQETDTYVYDGVIKSGALVPLRNMQHRQTNNQSTLDSRHIRNKFAQYFAGIGSVEWQYAKIRARNE